MSMEMILVFLLVAYGIWLAVYFHWESRQRKDEKSETLVPKLTAKEADVVGRSRFKMRRITPDSAIPTPHTATMPDAAEPEEKEPTFADRSERQTPARIPDEKLDEAFEHIEIPDVPLEYEDDEEPDIEEEEIVLAVGHQGKASGASFAEIDKAVRVAGDPSATLDERRRAGEVFAELKGTDMYDRFRAGADSIMNKIKGVSDRHLIQLISRDGDEEADAAGLREISDGQDGDSGFDIGKYV